MITKRDFILCGSCFCVKYSSDEYIDVLKLLFTEIMFLTSE